MSDYGHLFRVFEALKAEYEKLLAEVEALKAALDKKPDRAGPPTPKADA